MQEVQTKLLLGNKIKQLREYRGFTQEQICDLINLSQPNLSNIENGKSFPAFETFLSLLEVLKVSPNDMLGFLEVYADINIVDDIDKKLFLCLCNLPEKTKKIICEIING